MERAGYEDEEETLSELHLLSYSTYLESNHALVQL